MLHEHLISNPIIPGFYPDPSICRKGDDFYLACSSFELYPGIPVFHSGDLAHWKQISYAMTKENGFHVFADKFNGGIMAPTIRYHKGLFYIICCNFCDKGTFIVTAEDPAGPWSMPRWITDIPDLDCSLFFDEDDRTYLVFPGNDETQDNHRAIFLIQYDLERGCRMGEKKKIWDSALRRANSPEAPHIYRIGDYYYLMISEGGTEHFHSVAIARSRTVDGFYHGYEANPVMTHRHMGFSYPIDNIGHADLIETPDGHWYAVMLGSRIVEGQHKNLGRETYLCPVVWERDWPVFSPGSGKIEWDYPADSSLVWEDGRQTDACVLAENRSFGPMLDHFDLDRLNFHWNFWGTPYGDFFRIRNSRLFLKCLARPLVRQLKFISLGETEKVTDDCLSLIARRQTDISFEVTVEMTFTPRQQETAGLVIMQAANHMYRLEKFAPNKLRLVQVTTRQHSLVFLPDYSAQTEEVVLAETDLSGQLEESCILRLRAEKQRYLFLAGKDPEHLIKIAEADGALINPEEMGGMTGTMIGLFASANQEKGYVTDHEASFDFFCYQPID